MSASDPAEPPGELSHAGSVVDQAISFMMDKELGSLAIASALLGGALGLMARTLPQEAIVQVLQKAIETARAGGLARMDRPAD